MKQFILLSAFQLLAATGVVTPLTAQPFQTETYHELEKRYNIAERGAVGDGETLNTKAIQSVIDECAQNGGGTILIPKGVFKSGSLFLKSGVNMELQEGAVL